MKPRLFTFAALLLLAGAHAGHAQSARSFRKGTLAISLSEGATFTRYATMAPGSYAPSGAMIAPQQDGGSGAYTPDVITDGNVNGDRDPLCIEYGLSDKVGISISMGGDVLKLNTGKFYNFMLPGKTKAITSETTFDINYHFLATKRFDVAVYGSVGLASVALKGTDGDREYSYTADGAIARLGTRAKYYFTKRVGIVGMVSVFTTNLSSANFDEKNTFGAGYTTSIRGCAIEFGPCVRILR